MLELTGPTYCPSGATVSTWERRRNASEYLKWLRSSLGKTTLSSGMRVVCPDIISASNRSPIFQLMYSVSILSYISLYQYSYPSTHSISRLDADSASERFKMHQKITMESTQTLEGGHCVNLDRELEAVNERCRRGTVKSWLVLATVPGH